MTLGDVAKTTWREVCFVERNLKALRDMPRVGVNNIRDFRGAFQKKFRQRKGRGGKRGGTSGRGHKGLNEHSTINRATRVGYEGGQTPFYLRFPKNPHANLKRYLRFVPLPLGKIQYFIDSKRIDPTKKIDLEMIVRSGLGPNPERSEGYKITSEGHTWFQGKIDIEVSMASAKSIVAIERNGGVIKTMFYDKQKMLSIAMPDKYPLVGQDRARCPPLRMLYYAKAMKRGFLADPDEVKALREENLKLGPEVATDKVDQEYNEID